MTEFERELLARIDLLTEENRQLRAELMQLTQKKPTAAQKKKAAAPKGRAARAITREEYAEIIDTIRAGGCGFEPNERIATIFVLQANLGLRLGDVLALRMTSFVRDGSRWRLNIVEEKTGKVRDFTVPADIIAFIQEYRENNGIGPRDLLFPLQARGVQKYLKKVTDYLDDEKGKMRNVTSHSFRKLYATKIYNNNKHNIVLVQELLQHASAGTTQKYIGLRPAEVEAAIADNVDLR